MQLSQNNIPISFKNIRYKKEVHAVSLIALTINDKKVYVEEGSTILQAARMLNINIPTLCHLNMHDGKTTNHPGSCRVCVVEVVGRRNLAPACSTPATNGMIIKTTSIRAIKARRTVLELILSDHPQDCLLCEKNTMCELQRLAAELGIREIRYKGEMSTYPIDSSSYSIVRDLDKCILCRRCETVCNEIQTVGAISGVGRGFETVVSTCFFTTNWRNNLYFLWTMCFCMSNWCINRS